MRDPVAAGDFNRSPTAMGLFIFSNAIDFVALSWYYNRQEVVPSESESEEDYRFR